MAKITITYPTSWTPQVVASLCAANGYQALIAGQPNPETADVFALRMIRNYVTFGTKGGNRVVKVAAANVASDTDDTAIDAAFTIAYSAT